MTRAGHANLAPSGHPLAVMKRLGHSSVTVTSNTDGHLFPALEEALTVSLDRSYLSAKRAMPEPLPGSNCQVRVVGEA